MVVFINYWDIEPFCIGNTVSIQSRPVFFICLGSELKANINGRQCPITADQSYFINNNYLVGVVITNIDTDQMGSLFHLHIWWMQEWLILWKTVQNWMVTPIWSKQISTNQLGTVFHLQNKCISSGFLWGRRCWYNLNFYKSNCISSDLIQHCLPFIFAFSWDTYIMKKTDPECVSGTE